MSTITSTLTRAEALHLVEACSNQPKRTYVRVGERKHMERHAIEGMPEHILVLHTEVYSKTWAKNTARVWHRGEGTPTELTTKAAKKLLAA